MATINIVNGPGIWEVMQAYFNYTEDRGSVGFQTKSIELEIDLNEAELKQLHGSLRSMSQARLKRTVQISIEGLQRRQEGSRVLHDLSGCLYLAEEDLELFSMLKQSQLKQSGCPYTGSELTKTSILAYGVTAYDLRNRRGELWLAR